MSETFFEAAELQIDRDEFRAAMAVTNARFPDVTLEAERVLCARDFLAAAFALEQALRIHARCALVNHYGSRGTNNFAEATERLFFSLGEYAASIRRIAQRFRDFEMPDLDDADAIVPSGLRMQVVR